MDNGFNCPGDWENHGKSSGFGDEVLGRCVQRRQNKVYTRHTPSSPQALLQTASPLGEVELIPPLSDTVVLESAAYPVTMLCQVRGWLCDLKALESCQDDFFSIQKQGRRVSSQWHRWCNHRLWLALGAASRMSEGKDVKMEAGRTALGVLFSQPLTDRQPCLSSPTLRFGSVNIIFLQPKLVGVVCL